MFVTNDPNLYEQVLTLSNHGRAQGQTKQFWADMVGFKYKMSNIQAAIGCAQMERIEDLIGRKREILKEYRRGLEGVEAVTMNPEPHGVTIGGWMPTVVFSRESGVTREGIQEDFKKADIDARVFFWPLSGLPMFEPQVANRNASEIPSRSINLPSYHELSADQICAVCDIVIERVKNSKK
jgi:perosamine synthetase